MIVILVISLPCLQTVVVVRQSNTMENTNMSTVILIPFVLIWTSVQLGQIYVQLIYTVGIRIHFFTVVIVTMEIVSVQLDSSGATVPLNVCQYFVSLV